MKIVKRLVKAIDEELCGAEEYAEKAIEATANADMSGERKWVETYKGMAEDELKHASILHERAVSVIENLRSVYTPPADMLQKWEESHNGYIERTNRIKSMLNPKS